MKHILFGLLWLLTGWASCAAADTLQVLTAGAFKQVVQEVAPDFEKNTGHQIRIVNDTAGNLVRRIGQGEPFDVVVLTPSALEGLEKQGHVLPGTLTPLARVGVGVAVRQGQPRPRLSDVDDFVMALKSARRVAYIDPASGGSSGIYLQGLFRRLHLDDVLAGKSVLVNGGLVAEKLVTGQADLAIHQISEILAVSGADLVGPLPESIQNYTRYAGALGMHSTRADVGRQFLAALSSPLALQVMARKGLER